MILVTGATGQLGSAVVDRLLQRIDAADVAILARDPAKAEDLAGRGVSVRTGDYDDTASLARAMDGVDRVVMVASNQPQRRVQQPQDVIDAAAGAGVSVFGFTSRSLNDIESSRNQLMRDYFDTEELIQRSGVQSLIFRNALYLDSYFDYLVWNEPYARLRHDPATLPAERRNMIWMMFTDPDNRARMTRWEAAARAVLSQFRIAAGQHPGDSRFTELIAALTEAGPEFRDWWAGYPVRYFKPAIIAVNHPQAGLVQLEMFQLPLTEHPGLLMVIQVPASQADRTPITSLLQAQGRRLHRHKR